MRVTRKDVPQQPDQPTGRRLPEPSPTFWSVLAIAGGAAAVYAAAPEPATVLVSIFGVIGLAVAQHRLGFLDARRHADPRVAELARERDHWRALADFAGRLMAIPPVGGAAPAGDRPDGGPAPAEPRPSAGVRGGGRPGAVGSVGAASLDAPLPGEAGGITE